MQVTTAVGRGWGGYEREREKENCATGTNDTSPLRLATVTDAEHTRNGTIVGGDAAHRKRREERAPQWNQRLGKEGKILRFLR